MRRITLRALVAVVAALGVLAAAVPAGAVLPPPPPGDDGVRYFWSLQSPTCGPTGITTASQSVTWENVPPSGAEYYYWYTQNGDVYLEDGPYPPAGTGDGSQAYAGFGFPSAGYPQSAAIFARMDVGGEPTYVGGTIIFCSSQGATPAVSSLEDFFPPCGVDDRAVFPDVPASSPFCKDIWWASIRGITTGYPDGGFHPTAPVTRQAMAAFLYRTAGSPEVSVPCVSAPFPDVPTGHPFCPEIGWIADEGITGGYGDGTFRPGADVSRQAMAAFLYRTAGEPDGADPTCVSAPFPDVPTGHPFCGEIAWMADTGISTGYGDGTFRPGADVSRQATVAFLHRLDDLPVPM